MRNEAPTDFTVPVEGIGTFRFARRTMRDQFSIDTEIARLTDGLDNLPEYLALAASAVACIKVLAVESPAGWDPEKLDPLEEESYRQLLAVHRALRESEGRFRGRPGKGSEESRSTDGEDGGVLVPEEVQPDPE